MKNTKQIWQETVKRLGKIYDQREAENIVYLLLEDAFEISRSDILLEGSKEIDQGRLEGMIERLANYEPIQYVTGIADFYSRKFHLSPGALIPRPETEELCDLIIRENQTSEPKIMDVGVGSGCIAITLSLELNGSVSGTDVSADALAAANRNARLLDASVSFVKNDVLKEILPENQLDILVSNPPYIPALEQREMRRNVLQYEPALALFVPDENPILFYQRIAKLGVGSLKKGGGIYFEIHEKFGEQVKNCLEKTGYTDAKIHQDMQGKDRMISAINRQCQS